MILDGLTCTGYAHQLIHNKTHKSKRKSMSGRYIYLSASLFQNVYHLSGMFTSAAVPALARGTAWRTGLVHRSTASKTIRSQTFVPRVPIGTLCTRCSGEMIEQRFSSGLSQ
jgi:hypothetical protein